MSTILDGKKGAWGWNWERWWGGSAARARQAIQAMGLGYVLQKAHDGPRWHPNGGVPFLEIVAILKDLGLTVGGWGYFYFQDIAGEAQRVIETIKVGRCDFYAFNIEDPSIERMSDVAKKAEYLFRRVREAVGPGYPLFFTSYANPAAHTRQPYYQAMQAGIHHMPMAYHNAMQVTPERSLDICYAQHAQFGLLDGVDLVPAGGAYSTSAWKMDAAQIVRWANYAFKKGARSVNWWSIDWLILNEPVLQAGVAQVVVPGAKPAPGPAPDPAPGQPPAQTWDGDRVITGWTIGQVRDALLNAPIPIWGRGWDQTWSKVNHYGLGGGEFAEAHKEVPHAGDFAPKKHGHPEYAAKDHPHEGYVRSDGSPYQVRVDGT